VHAPGRAHVFKAGKRLVAKRHMPPALVPQRNAAALQGTSFDSAGATAIAAEPVCGGMCQLCDWRFASFEHMRPEAMLQRQRQR